MLIEVALLQRFVLLLGHPVYSLTVTLLSLLLGTGIGSVLSRHVTDAAVSPNRRAGLPGDRGRRRRCGRRVLPARHQPWRSAGRLPLRLATAIALMLPAGMLMGIPLPAGVRLLVDRNVRTLIAWAWGINGALSVLGATLAVFIAMNWGFSTTLLWWRDSLSRGERADCELDEHRVSRSWSSVHRIRLAERERRDLHVEGIAFVRDHLIGAFHDAERRGQVAAGDVRKRFAGRQHWLLADDARAAHLFDAAGAVGDHPVTGQQLHRLRALRSIS